ncbi:MAG: hypothetical protein FD124_1640 [Alphaproteobacteria bacterium]|nr:MAG: hypothetical protein FD160_1525 [Caulobacteraceae bacterium]TPW06640.1 MAG: hypothetical protein FD124_1640 [Alphaproteobacteria bacterium]
MIGQRSTRSTRYVEVKVGPYGMRAIGEYDWEGGMRMFGQLGPFPPPFMVERVGGALDIGSGFPRALSPGSLRYNPKKQLPLRDFEEIGPFWCISQRALELLKVHAEGDFDVMSVNVVEQSPGSAEILLTYWYCDVVRFEDCIDESASEITWSKWGNLRTYDIVSKKLVIRSDLRPDATLFRLARAPTRVLCTTALMEAIKTANLTGIKFAKLDRSN